MEINTAASISIRHKQQANFCKEEMNCKLLYHIVKPEILYLINFPLYFKEACSNILDLNGYSTFHSWYFKKVII